MKTFKILLSIFLIALLTTLIPSIYAIDVLFTFDNQKYEIPLSYQKEFEGRIYLLLDNKDTLFITDVTSKYNNKETKINTIYNQLWVEYNSKHVKIDLSTNLSIKVNSDNIVFTSNDSSFTLKKTDTISFRMYFDTINSYCLMPDMLVFESNISDKVPLNDFISNFLAWDPILGDVSSSITVIEDDYTPNIGNVGEYNVQIQCEGMNKVKSTTSFRIKTIDTTPPNVSSVDSVDVGYNDELDINKLISDLTITDDGTKSRDGFLINILNNDYENNKDKLGSYEILFSIKDQSGNATNYSQTINVVDNVAPKSNLANNTHTFEKHPMDILTLDEILEFVKDNTYDEISDELTISVISDDYSENMHIEGSCRIRYRVADEAGNNITVTIYVLNSKIEVPRFLIAIGTHYIDNINYLSDDDIKTVIKNKLKLSNDSIEIVLNEYKGCEDTEGIYRVNFIINGDYTNEQQLLLRVNEVIEQVIENKEEDYSLYIIGSIITGVLVIGFITYKIVKRRRQENLT